MIKKVSEFIDFKFVLRFAAIFLSLYYLNLATIGITTEGGSFSPFVNEYLNYPVWMRQAVLGGSKFLATILGIKVNMHDPFLTLGNGSMLEMAWPCVGLGMMSFWFAFSVAHQNTRKAKIMWTFFGVFAIYLLNVTRVFALILTMNYGWGFQKEMSAHELFNYLCYGLIAIMIWRFKANHSRLMPLAIA